MVGLFQRYRRQIRRFRNNKRLEKEALYYKQRFNERRLQVPTENKLRKKYADLFPGIARREKGELSILAIYHHYNWENEALLPSLKKFGRVIHYDWFSEFNQQDEKTWHKKNKRRMNTDLIRKVQTWIQQENIDVIFTYFSGETVYPETIKTIASMGVPIINLALNDKESFVGKIRNGQAMGARDICRFYHFCWTSTQDALVKYVVEGALPIYLPEGGNPEIHKPYFVDQDIDVSFVGQCYGNRPMIIDKLCEKGIPVKAYGYNWPQGPLSTEEMVKMYSRSKINLGFGGVAGLNETFCLKGRDFEIPMSGGFYLTEHNEELERCFLPGKEIVTYHNFDDLVEKINFYLGNEDEREKIRQKGYDAAVRQHTWESRFEQIFSILGVLVKPVTCGKKHKPIDHQPEGSYDLFAKNRYRKKD
ncbi:CgeB family protein [Desulfobacter vibrioformis]|uniref:CgeB family protein n=1 Tax=Desulfobacter vibrioformis TaxID=34031 RepID=UPI000A06A3C4|nr:glycosyltransferase [Desulfobacter vibrioformis]